MGKMTLDMTKAEIFAYLIERDGYRCTFPGCTRPLGDPKDIDTLDHIYPQFLAKAAGWTRAETNALSNLQIQHKTCNARKGHQLPDENGNFNIPVKEPRPIKGPRPEVCELCFAGRLLFPGEECPDCGLGPQPFKYPRTLQRKPKECDHSTYHCWICTVDQPNLRVPAIERIITGP